MKLSRNSWFITLTTAAALTALVSGVSTADADPVQASSTGALTSASAATLQAGSAATAVHGRLGKIIHTGLDASPISEWVFYGVPVPVAHTKKKTFGFAVSERQNNGDLTKYLVISETTKGAALKPGFHAVEGAYTLENDLEQPAYGYFVGKPAKITGKVDGRTVTAKKAKWSVNKHVTVFWFDNTKVTGGTTLTSVSAYNKAGKRLDKSTVDYSGE